MFVQGTALSPPRPGRAEWQKLVVRGLACGLKESALKKIQKGTRETPCCVLDMCQIQPKFSKSKAMFGTYKAQR